jgi:hypothetical protein
MRSSISRVNASLSEFWSPFYFPLGRKGGLREAGIAEREVDLDQFMGEGAKASVLIKLGAGCVDRRPGGDHPRHRLARDYTGQ